jgi:hypothetical protein
MSLKAKKDCINQKALEKIIFNLARGAGTSATSAARDIITECLHFISNHGGNVHMLHEGALEVWAEEKYGEKALKIVEYAQSLGQNKECLKHAPRYDLGFIEQVTHLLSIGWTENRLKSEFKSAACTDSLVMGALRPKMVAVRGYGPGWKGPKL